MSNGTVPVADQPKSKHNKLTYAQVGQLAQWVEQNRAKLIDYHPKRDMPKWALEAGRIVGKPISIPSLRRYLRQSGIYPRKPKRREPNAVQSTNGGVPAGVSGQAYKRLRIAEADIKALNTILSAMNQRLMSVEESIARILS